MFRSDKTILDRIRRAPVHFMEFSDADWKIVIDLAQRGYLLWPAGEYRIKINPARDAASNPAPSSKTSGSSKGEP